MRGVVMYAPCDVRVEQREDARIIEPTDAVIRVTAACICGSDLWPYRGIEALNGPTPMGHGAGAPGRRIGHGGKWGQAGSGTGRHAAD